MFATEVDKIPRHLRLTPEMDVQVCGQHVMGPKALQMHLASRATGDAIGTRRRCATRLVDRVVKTMPTHRRTRRAKRGVLQKRRLSVAKLLQALGHTRATGNETDLGMALPVLID